MRYATRRFEVSNNLLRRPVESGAGDMPEEGAAPASPGFASEVPGDTLYRRQCAKPLNVQARGKGGWQLGLTEAFGSSVWHTWGSNFKAVWRCLD